MVAPGLDVELLAACREWLRNHEIEKALWEKSGRLASDGIKRNDQEVIALAAEMEMDAEEAAKRQCVQRPGICAMPALTISGLHAKAKVLQADGFVFPNETGSTIDENAARQIFADIETLATVQSNS